MKEKDIEVPPDKSAARFAVGHNPDRPGVLNLVLLDHQGEVLGWTEITPEQWYELGQSFYGAKQ